MSHPSRFVAALCAVVLTLLASVATAASPPRYSVQITGVEIYPNYGYITGMNKSGQICYWSDIHSNGNRGYFWNGSQNVLLDPASGPDTIPMGVNDSGKIAGFYGYSYSNKTAALWDQSGLHPLGTLGGANSWAEAIAPNGVIAGRSENATTNFQRHLFTYDSAMHDRGQLPTFYDEILAINDSTQILGRQGGAVIGGWIWQNGSYTFLKDLVGGNYSAPYDLNESGVAVGMSWPNQSNSRAVRWNAGQTNPQQLPLPLDAQSVAYSVNDDDDSVGYYKDPAQIQRQALLWHEGNFFRLDQLIDSSIAWQINEGWEINDNGQILALANAPQIGWREVLLTPTVPEPSAFTVLLLAAPHFLRRRR